MIKVLVTCHGSILKSPEKASKINGFTKQKGVYYTTTSFFERALNDNGTRSEPRGAAVAYKRKVPTASDKKNKEQPFFEAAPCSF